MSNSVEIPPTSTTTPAPSTGQAAVILLVLAVCFAIAAVSFGSTIYHREETRLEETNAARKQQKFTPAPGMPAETETPPEQFRWSMLLLALLGGDAKYGPAFLWCFLGLITTLAGAAWVYQMQPTSVDELRVRKRIVALLVGGLIGLYTLGVLGIFYTYHWWGELTGSRANWNTLPPWLPLIFMLAGLLIMFCSLLPARSEERRSATLRRAFYGYNAFLSSLFLLGLLAVANVLTFFYFTNSYDWTAMHIYSISPQSKQILESLQKPVKVYVFMDRSGVMQELYSDVETLLNTCKQYSNKLEVEYLSPFANQGRYAELMQRHEVLLPEPREANLRADVRDFLKLMGILVVYDDVNAETRNPRPSGSEPAQKQATPRPPSVFLGLHDLEEGIVGRFSGSSLTRQFQGEKALMSALTYLRDDELSYVLLFATDCGEMSPAQIQGEQGSGLSPRSVARLRQQLRLQSGYETRTFPLGEVNSATKSPRPVPQWIRLKTPAEQSAQPQAREDWVPATLEQKKLDTNSRSKYFRVLGVVLADPTQVTPLQCQVLDDYMNKQKGNLIVLADVHRDPAGKMQPLGYEEFLRNFGVLIRDEQVLQAAGRLFAGQSIPQALLQPENVMAMISPSAVPQLQILRQQIPRLMLAGARPVLPAASKENLYEAQTLAAAPQGHWAEKEPILDVRAYVAKLSDEQLSERAMSTTSAGVPIVVTVSRAGPAELTPGKSAAPRPALVVFGDATFLSDQGLARADAAANYAFFVNTLAWLRGRPELIGGFEPKTRASYRLGVRPEQLPMWSPGLLLLATIAAAGIGVTMLRRR